MFKNITLACIVMAIGVIVTMTTDRYFKNNHGDFFILEQGKAVPDFKFETMQGKAYKFSDFQGRLSIIHFWASWCAPCVVEFPELVSLARNKPDSVILAFSGDRTMPAIDRFLTNHAPDLPENFLVIHDANGAITKDKFSVFQLPESFVVGKDGLLNNHIVGAYQGWDSFVE